MALLKPRFHSYEKKRVFSDDNENTEILRLNGGKLDLLIWKKEP
jgi:hypothetical protein